MLSVLPSLRPRKRSTTRHGAGGIASRVIAVCMVATAASLAAVIYLRFDVSLAQAGSLGLAALLVMVLAEFFAAMQKEQATTRTRLVQANAAFDRLSGEIARIEARIDACEKALPRQVEENVEQRLTAVDAGLEGLSARLSELEEAAVARQAAPELPGVAYAAEDAAADAIRETAAPETLDAVRDAIDGGRLDVFLQPIVQLPQRRTRHYEALTRLRGEDGREILPDSYLPVAEPSGLMPRIDNTVFHRATRIAQRLSRRNAELAIFCNISLHTLSDGALLPRFIDYMSENPELARTLVLEIPQAVLDRMGPIEEESLASLTETGLRISVDHVHRIDIDGHAYARRGVRFVKIDAGVLLDPPPGAHIHVADMASLLARSNIELVATRIETESQMVDLLDYEVPLGQGLLFAPPRAVRGDLLDDPAQGIPWFKEEPAYI